MTETRRFGSSSRESHDASIFYDRKLVEVKENKKSVRNPAADSVKSRIICDSSESMSYLPDNSVSLMVTSPPYHNGKDYDTDTTLSEYLDLVETVLKETYRVLEPGGRVAINLAGLGRKPYVPLQTYVDVLMQDMKFIPRGWIVWIKAAGASGNCAWGSWLKPSNPSLRDLHEFILIYSKDRFDYPKKDIEPDIEPEDFMNWTLSVWNIPAERASIIGHPSPFPVELPRRLIKLYTYKNDIVLDPFAGACTTAVAALIEGRRYVCYDTIPEYVDIGKTRVSKQERILGWEK